MMVRIVVYLNGVQADLLDKLKNRLGAKSRYAICKRYILDGMRRDLEKLKKERGGKWWRKTVDGVSMYDLRHDLLHTRDVHHYALTEFEKPENARWLALLMDTEGSIGWVLSPVKRDRINGKWKYVYPYHFPYVSVGMSERESKATIDEAANILGIKASTVKGIRRLFTRGGRALTAIGYMKPHLVKFKRMANLLQAIFENRPTAPSTQFKTIITTLFGKYIASEEANYQMSLMTEHEFTQLLQKAEKLADQYLPPLHSHNNF